MKTIREWLETLPDGYRERALRNMDERFANLERRSFYDAVDQAFIWDATPEGLDFWHSVACGSFPPLPPEPETVKNLQQLKVVLEDQLAVKADDITPETGLIEDLNCDSLDLVEIAMAVEDEFTIHISDPEIEGWNTVADILATIESAQ